VRSVLVCVRTPIAAQSVAAVAARLGLSGAVRTAVSEPEAMSRLGERAADVVLADTGVTRPDTVGFTRRVLARSPGAAVLLIGTEDPGVANAAVAAGARGLVQSGERDLVGAIAKAIMLLSVPRRPSAGPSPGATRQPPPSGRPGPPAEAGPPRTAGATAGAPRTAGGAAGAPRTAGLGGAASGGGAGRTGPVGAGSGADGGDPPSVVPVQRGDDAPAGDPKSETRGGPANEPAPVNRGPEPRSTRPPLSPPGSAAYPTSPDPRANVAADARFGGPRRGVPAKPGGYSLPAPAAAGPVRRVTLTEREMQVLVGMAEGKSNAEIGRELFVSEDTVKTHARRLFRKLGARDRAHAVAAGFRAGLVA
jgi:DNA-binding NarL/FixJ family response regulator